MENSKYTTKIFGCTKTFELSAENFVRKFDSNFYEGNFGILKLCGGSRYKRGGEKLYAPGGRTPSFRKPDKNARDCIKFKIVSGINARQT